MYGNEDTCTKVTFNKETLFSLHCHPYLLFEREKKIVSSKFDEKYEMHLVLWMLNELNC